VVDETTLPKLLTGLQDFAHDLLKSAGGFPPFGGTVSSSGEFGLVVNMNDLSKSTPDAALQYITNALQSDAGKQEALGVVFMAHMSSPGEAAQAAAIYTLHVRGSDPIDIIEPFARDQSGQVTYGEFLRRASAMRLFADDRPLASKGWPRAN
jgi:hypothetical protein